MKAQSLIHHSDRGVQYCSTKYVKLLNKHNAQISMTENGDPRENAVAERINGIIKEEYLFAHIPKSITQAKEILDQVVDLYNKERPHMSLGNQVPEKVHINPEKKGKNYGKIIIKKIKPLINFRINFTL